MRQSAPYAVIGIGILLMAAIAWWFGFREKPAPPAVPEPAPSITLSEGLSIYTSGEHGFLIAYPEGARVVESFEGGRLPSVWRVGAAPSASGTPLLSIMTYQVAQESAYPRHYEVSLRIGKSEDASEIARCLQAENGEIEGEDVLLGESAFKSFAFADAAMQRQVSGVSYRTVKDGACWAMEAVRDASTYREAATASDIPDSVLEAEFARLMEVKDTFRFAR